MRMLLRVSIPVETGNAAAKAGTLGSTVKQILADLKPEAAYFFADDNGQRSGSIVFDMKDSSEIPAIAEPWFLAFNAKVSFGPIMNPQDLAMAVPSISRAAEQCGNYSAITITVTARPSYSLTAGKSSCSRTVECTSLPPSAAKMSTLLFSPLRV